MTINLHKGQTIDLRKNNAGGDYDLSTVTIGLGWDVKEQNKSFLGSLFGRRTEEYDLDAVAFLLDANDKVINKGEAVSMGGNPSQLEGGDIVFFNALKHFSGHVWLTGDNRSGEGEGDDEQIIVQLDQLDIKYQKIVFIVAIYQGEKRKQHFGMVDNAFIRAVDNRGTEIAKFSLSGNSDFNHTHSMIFAEICRRAGSWEFRAIGEPRNTDNFVDILSEYL
ncbi:TerD family protein [Pedobacter sp. MR2016-24]|uniref:TerD family protein n=1 Tax=Pedobacter sp. MR2016-24 TaxID=2994466 RepID=UPI0022456D4E|nr:TerD family protein [Pedobacter sp. MR2016-24]MCX2484904.1 TerD family protein [Pedobacter sp. MR2016-24]